MSSNLSVHPQFQTDITYGQFAKLGIWEEAWVIQPNGMPEQQTVVTYLAGAHEVAFEVFLGNAFFGLRCKGTADEVKQFALACVQAMRCKSSAAFFAHLSEFLSFKTWGEQVEFAEVGATNFWKSIGSYRVPDLAAAQANPDALFQTLLNQAVGKTTLHPKAMELGCGGRLAHWFGLPISAQEAPFALSLDALKGVLALACSSSELNSIEAAQLLGEH